MDTSQKVETILCIPGSWKDRQALVQTIALKSQGYIFAGSALLHTSSGTSFLIDPQGRDERLAEAFAIASRFSLGHEQLSQALVDDIEKHTQILYLIGEGGSLEKAHQMIQAGIALLDAGGLAVKVETAGIAHSSKQWRSYGDGTANSAFEAFVTFIRTRQSLHSVGMHNLGYRDALIDTGEDIQESYQTLGNFLLYTLIESPMLKDGETFSLEQDAPYFQLHAEACKTYPPDDPFHNPFGVWHLKSFQK